MNNNIYCIKECYSEALIFVGGYVLGVKANRKINVDILEYWMQSRHFGWHRNAVTNTNES